MTTTLSGSETCGRSLGDARARVEPTMGGVSPPLRAHASTVDQVRAQGVGTTRGRSAVSASKRTRKVVAMVGLRADTPQLEVSVGSVLSGDPFPGQR